MTDWPLGTRRPILCLVTDRLSLARAIDPGADPTVLLLEQVSAAAEAGIDLVHVRERNLDAAALARLVRECVARTAGTPTKVVVNDRVDIAMVAGASGVHLRSDSMGADRVRAVAPGGFLLGRSVHSADDARSVADAGQVDYLVIGTVFPTPSKAGGHAVIGLSELERAARSSRVPVLAIGGVTAGTLPDVARAGAAGVAAIRLFQEGARSPGSLARRATEWRLLFDMHRPIP
jgi:thiamine-phosphate pyrophosphorylase